MNQIELHKKIDSLLLKNPADAEQKEVSVLISTNEDAHHYFFAKTDERWLNWLWKNGFLNVIKEKSEDPTKYGYRMPELNYLVRVTEKEPKKLTDIILSVPISEKTFNPEVVDRFLWICSTLPAEQLARIVPKIRDKKWIRLMGPFNQPGFEYEKMFQVLAGAKDYNSILVLAEAILAVRPKEEKRKVSNRITTDKPFFFDDLSNTKVFEYLIAVDDKYAEQAMELATKVMAKIVILGDKAESDEVFPVREIFYLLDVDFFSLTPSKEVHLSDRENVRELAATIKVLTQRLIEKNCHVPKLVHEIYKKYIETLPKSRLMWRLNLFVLSLCPRAFQDELKQSFSRLFEVMEKNKPYYEIKSGTEYRKALKKSFGFFDGNYQREYVKNVFKYFGASSGYKEKEQWHKRDGWQILSSICEHLTEDERESCKKIFGKNCDPAFEPEPSIGKIESGWVRPRGPITQEELGELSVTEIGKKLRSGWAPEALRKQNMSDDFLNPLNAEGASELLRNDIAKRLQEYVQHAGIFFEKGVLDEHYTYSFLRGIQEAIRADKSKVADIQWDKLIELLVTIKKSGEEEAFNHKAKEREAFNAWLSSWTGVHSAMSNVLQELLSEHEGKIILNFSKFHDQLFDVIDYLFAYPDPEPEDEELETAAMKTQSPSDKEYLVSDPFTMAINTVRGQAFQAFVLFVYQDGKKFNKDDDIKISSNVKNLYEAVLKKENTRALMFMFGHYLPSFYYRDKEWIRKLLPQIFPNAQDKKHLYLAAWEGYLANKLYQEIFFDPALQKLYERGLDSTDIKDPNRKHFKDPDESIAVHLALAFMYYEEFGLDHSLLKIFWENNNSEQHATFVSFLGRMFVSGDNARANELLEKEPRSKQRLKDLWIWLLENHEDTSPFVEFGFWISLEKDIFEPAWLAEHLKKTLEKTNGVLHWEHGLSKSILGLAKVSPKDSLEIARLYLLEGRIRGGKMRMPFIYDNEWFEALKILYGHSDSRDGTYALINDLIREGMSMFWVMKELIE